MSDKKESANKALERQRRQAEKEKKLMKIMLDGFDANSSPAYLLLYEKFSGPGGKNLSIKLLTPIAELFANDMGVQIPREAIRKRAMLIRWFDEHIEQLRPFLARVRAEFSGGEIV